MKCVQAICGVLLAFIAACAGAATATSAAVPYASCFERSAAKHELSADLLKAVAATESNYNPNARSHANAHGLMQIQWPGTAKHLGVRRLAELYSPCKNIELGARYLRELLGKYNGRERRALAAYNYGPGRIKAKGALPRGALRYVATVARHRSALGSKSSSPSSNYITTKTTTNTATNSATINTSKKQDIVSFSSRLRAARYLKLLRRKIPSAKFSLVKGSFGGTAIVLNSPSRLLSSDAKTLLKSLGWKE